MSSQGGGLPEIGGVEVPAGGPNDRVANAFRPAEVEALPGILKEARAFALKAHGAQKYGDQPFINHLDEVVRVLIEFDSPKSACTAGYLHDVLEDTSVVTGELVLQFGLPVASIVDACTFSPSARTPPFNKSEREACYRRIADVGSTAVLVKLADRLANVMASLRLYRTDKDRGSSYLSRYVKDQELLVPAFRDVIVDSKRAMRLFSAVQMIVLLAKDPEVAYQRYLTERWAPR